MNKPTPQHIKELIMRDLETLDYNLKQVSIRNNEPITVVTTLFKEMLEDQSKDRKQVYTLAEDQAVILMFNTCTDTEIGVSIGRTRISVSQRRVVLGLNKHKPKTATTSKYKFNEGRVFGKVCAYWIDESEIELSLNPVYNIEDLKGWEKKAVKKLKHTNNVR